jgi:hypothetical protein
MVGSEWLTRVPYFTKKNKKKLDFNDQRSVYYSIMKRKKNMNYIDLESVGSTVTSEGLVFPIDCSEPPVTASDADEMSGVNIFECSDEWYWNLSLVDGYKLLYFLDEHIGYDVKEPSGIHFSYGEWRDKVQGLMGKPDTLVAVA